MNFKDFTDMVIKGVSNVDLIAEGIWNHAKLETLPEDQQEEIARRTNICLSCPYNSMEAQSSQEYFDLFGKHYTNSRNDLHCAMCGCIIKFKTSALAADCGLGYYNSTHPENKQPLKWKSYKSKL
jgi:hypothetical protein